MHRDGQRDGARAATATEVARDALVVTCAVSAGIHAALTPEHLREEPAAGIGFLVSTVLLAALAVALLLRPASRAAAAGAAAVLAGLLVAYVLAVTRGVPVLHPEVEPADGLGLATKAVELVGLAAALLLVSPGRAHGRLTHLQPKGNDPMTQVRSNRPVSLGLTALIAFASALAALALSGGHDAQAHGEPAAAHDGTVTGPELALRKGMRSLWEDHVSWTRLAIISLALGAPEGRHGFDGRGGSTLGS